MDKDEPQIFPESDDSARYRTDIRGWVSRNGHFYGEDEKTARIDGCTHRKCEKCDAVINKSNFICTECLEKKKAENYLTKETRAWEYDVNKFIYSNTKDRFFKDLDELYEYLEFIKYPILKEQMRYGERMRKVAIELRIVLCRAIRMKTIELEDIVEDDIDDLEFMDVPRELTQLIIDMNNKISAMNPEIGWVPFQKYAWDGYTVFY